MPMVELSARLLHLRGASKSKAVFSWHRRLGKSHCLNFSGHGRPRLSNIASIDSPHASTISITP